MSKTRTQRLLREGYIFFTHSGKETAKPNQDTIWSPHCEAPSAQEEHSGASCTSTAGQASAPESTRGTSFLHKRTEGDIRLWE